MRDLPTVFLDVPKTRPHPLVLEQQREERREKHGWFLSKIGTVFENLNYFHAERPRRSLRHQLARRVGAVAGAAMLAGGLQSAVTLAHSVEDSGFHLNTPPQPVAAADPLESSFFENEHDPMTYSTVDAGEAAQATAHEFSTSFATIAALETGAVGLSAIAGVGFLQRRRRAQLYAQPVVMAASSQMSTFQSMLGQAGDTEPTLNDPHSSHFQPIASRTGLTTLAP